MFVSVALIVPIIAELKPVFIPIPEYQKFRRILSKATTKPLGGCWLLPK